jgi:dTDP-glucose pyrophosphorylase
MGPLGKRYAKALLPVGNEPVINHHVALLAALGVERIHVVVGQHAEGMASAMSDAADRGMRVEFVDQGPSLGSGHALNCLRGVIDDPFLLLLGDYYFRPIEPERMLRRLQAGESAIAVKRETDPALTRAACAVYMDPDGRVTGLVEKPIRPGNAAMKGCGFYAFQPDVFDAVARTPRTALRNEYELTVALDIFIGQGNPVFGEVVVEDDANLTRPEDLLTCNLEWLRRSRHPALVANSAFVDPGVTLQEVVVGADARVDGTGHVEEAVVFAGSRFRASGSIRGVIVTPDETIVVQRR